MLNLEHKLQSDECGVISPAISTDIYPFDMQLLDEEAPQRAAVEQFIRKGFYKSYQARIHSFMPVLLAIHRGHYRAAMGVRSAESKLFTEQYLDGAVEQHDYFTQKQVKREVIAEYGNLYSNTSRFTLPLFMVATVALFLNGYRYLVCPATRHVRQILLRSKVSFEHLSMAKEECVVDDPNDWGSYYQADPRVIAIDLAAVMQLIDTTPKLANMFNEVQAPIAKVASQLGGAL